MSEPLTRPYLEQMRCHVDEGGQLNHANGLDLLAEVERLHALVDPAQADAIYAAYLGIAVLRSVCKAAKLSLTEQRARDLMIELDTVFPGLSGRAALRTPDPAEAKP